MVAELEDTNAAALITTNKPLSPQYWPPHGVREVNGNRIWERMKQAEKVKIALKEREEAERAQGGGRGGRGRGG